MTAGARNSHPPRVLVGYDGSAGAANAAEVSVRLMPGFAAQVVHLWAPPFAGAELRRRRVGGVEELAAMLEREGAAEAERVAASAPRSSGPRAHGRTRSPVAATAARAWSWLGWPRSCGRRQSWLARAG
jgi:hypothetical protein